MYGIKSITNSHWVTVVLSIDNYKSVCLKSTRCEMKELFQLKYIEWKEKKNNYLFIYILYTNFKVNYYSIMFIGIVDRDFFVVL